MHKNSLNNFICHLSWLKKLSPDSYTSPQNHLWIFKTLWVIIFWVRVTHKMLNVNCIKIHSIILSVTYHGLRNFPLTHTHPLKTSHEFSKPYELLFFELESLIKCWMWIGKKIHSIILSVTCHGLRNFPLTHTHPLKTIHEFSKPYELLFFELESLIKCWMWLGIKIHSIILSVTCHGLRNFAPDSYTSPQNHLWIFKTLWVIIFWVRVTHKMLNVNWEKIHSIILSVTCHGLRNFPLLIHIPQNHLWIFQNPMSYYFSELESLIKCWMWLGIRIHSIILSVTCHGLRNFPWLIHIPSKQVMNFWDPMSYYFLS